MAELRWRAQQVGNSGFCSQFRSETCSVRWSPDKLMNSTPFREVTELGEGEGEQQPSPVLRSLRKRAVSTAHLLDEVPTCSKWTNTLVRSSWLTIGGRVLLLGSSGPQVLRWARSKCYIHVGWGPNSCSKWTSAQVSLQQVLHWVGWSPNSCSKWTQAQVS